MLSRALAVLALSATVARAQPAVQVPPDRGQLRIAARAGATFSDAWSQLGPSWLAGVQLGYAPPFWKHRLSLVIDALVTAPGSSGSRAANVAGGSLTWDAEVRTFVAGLSVELRHAFGRFAPYISAGVRLVYLDTLVSGSNGPRIVLAREQSVAAGFGGTIGVAVRLGPGELFLDAPVTWAPVSQKTLGRFDAGYVALALGWSIPF
jgi:hypothetical protein